MFLSMDSFFFRTLDSTSNHVPICFKHILFTTIGVQLQELSQTPLVGGFNSAHT